MRVLLDECLPKRLKREVAAEVVRTVPEMGWASAKNGALLRLAEQEFDVFLTADQHLERQQNLKSYRRAVVVLSARSNDIEDLRPLMPAVNEVLKTAAEGEIVYVKPQP